MPNSDTAIAHRKRIRASLGVKAETEAFAVWNAMPSESKRLFTSDQFVTAYAMGYADTAAVAKRNMDAHNATHHPED